MRPEDTASLAGPNPAEMLMLHDPENDKSLVLLIFETS